MMLAPTRTLCLAVPVPTTPVFRDSEYEIKPFGESIQDMILSCKLYFIHVNKISIEKYMIINYCCFFKCKRESQAAYNPRP